LLAVGVFNVMDDPYLAKADGTDDTAEIQAAIDAASAGDTIYFPPGVFDVNTAGGLAFNKRLTVIGHGATLRIGDSVGDAAFLAISGDDCRVYGLTVDGTANLAAIITGGWTAASATDRAALLITGDRCIIRDVTVTDVVYGVQFDAAEGGEVTGCNISNATVVAGAGYGNDCAGIYLDDANNIKVHANTITGFGLNISGGLSPTRCYIYSNQLHDADEHSIYISSGEYLNIYDNQIKGFDITGIKVRGTHDLNIHHNRIESTLTEANATGISMEGRGAAEADGFNGRNFICQSNIIHGRFDEGIVMLYNTTGGQEGSIRNYSILDNMVVFEDVNETFYGWGLKISSSCDRAVISGNLISGHTRGLVVTTDAGDTNLYAENMVITDNVFSEPNNTLTGALDKAMAISLQRVRYAYVAGNQCDGVYAANDSEYGIFLTTVTYSQFVNNDCGDHQPVGTNAYGIYEGAGCDYNTYWHNHVVRDDGTVMTNSMYVTGSNSRGEAFWTMANDATPDIAGARYCLTGGTTTITDFDGGASGQMITVYSGHAITITDGTNIFLAGSGNFVMGDTDTLTIILRTTGNWYEVSRSDN